MSVQFRVVVPCYNCVKWLIRSLESIASQDYTNYTVCVVDDASTDPSVREEIRRFCMEREWKWRFEPTNRGSLHSIVAGIQELDPDDDDVIITVDGDDWLADSTVFSYIASIYEEGGVDLTYGHFRYFPGGEEGAQVPYLPGEPRERQGAVLPAPLRTFRAFLWKAIDPKDLQDERGEYLRYATDWAFMLPMLEMAGDRIYRTERILYIYNYANPINEWKIALPLQKAVQRSIMRKPAYSLHPRCASEASHSCKSPSTT